MPETEVREALRRLSVPPEEPRFFEELRDRIHEHDRAAARRWRRTAVALAAAAIGAAAAAGVFAAGRGGGAVVDREVSCRVQGLANFSVGGTPLLHGFDYAVLGVSADHGSPTLFAIDTRYKGFTLDGSRCRPLGTRFPLVRRGLPPAGLGVYPAGSYEGVDGHCYLTGALARSRVELHVRIRLDNSGKARAATLAVRMQRKHRPIAFVRWSPRRLVMDLSRNCST